MQKRLSFTVIDIRPRQVSAAIAGALRKTSIDAFGGVPSDGVTPGDLISGFPVNLSDPNATENAMPVTTLPSDYVVLPDANAFLESGDTVFEELTLGGGVYTGTLPIDFYRDVWFDGLKAERNDHYLLTSTRAIDPTGSLDAATSVTAKYVIA